MSSVAFGREVVGDLNVGDRREWLVANGLGSYGSGSVCGTITRGYHGLLVTAVKPPVDRRVMLVKVDESIVYRGKPYDLAANQWSGGAVAPSGYRNIESFELEGSIPVWRYTLGNAIFEKRIWMDQGKQTTYVGYAYVAGDGPIQVSARVIVDNRVFHNTGMVAWPISVESYQGGLRVVSGGEDALPLTLRLSTGTLSATQELYQNFLLPMEATRGLNDRDSHAHAADLAFTLNPGESAFFLGSAETDVAMDLGALDRRRQRDRELLRSKPEFYGVPVLEDDQPMIDRLVLAADQFIVDRPSQEEPTGKSVIAGYHWFEDWGRDTMISLPGLCLAAGRPNDAAPILRTFARYVDEGMLPNRFPDGAETPEYNTIDATLWYFQAIADYWEATADDSIVHDLFPTLESIIEWHVKGTRYGIVMDPEDHLLRGGVDGVQLTWMDARVGDHVITPRIGKPVEVNALWYNALCVMTRLAKKIGTQTRDYRAMAQATRQGFDRFWNAERSYLFDVIDGPQGHEDLLRPNQLFAVALPESPLSDERCKQVVDACGEALLTSHGLRSLSPDEAAYVGSYGGDQYHRDSSYHQGTVWGWLIGPFVTAHLRVYGDIPAAKRFLDPFKYHVMTAGLGSISEIFDGDAPFEPRGCIAQAWSVAQVLSSYARLAKESARTR